MVLLLVVLFAGACFASDLQNSIPKCALDDPKVGNCIIKVGNALKPQFIQGIKELGIPSYDPLRVKRFDMKQESDTMNYTSKIRNCELRGVNNFDLIDIHYDPVSATFKGKVRFDHVKTNGHYKSSGTLLSAPIGGSGTYQLNFDGITMTFEINGDVVQNQNVDYYHPKAVTVKLNIDDIFIHLNGLFGDNKELSDRTNELMNQNSKTLLEAGIPALEAVIEQFTMRYLRWLTNEYPYYKLFKRS